MTTTYVEPRQVWLVMDTGPIGAPVSEYGPQPLGVCENESEAHAVAAWRYAVERRTTELRPLPFIPEAVALLEASDAR